MAVGARSLYLVYGGELVDPAGTAYVEPCGLDIRGSFESYEDAYEEWRRASFAAIDDAFTRYRIVRLS